MSLYPKHTSLLAQGSKQIWQDMRETYRLSLPLIVTYAGNHMMGLVDTAIVGRLGAVEIAGTGMGNSLFFLVSLLGMGLLHGLDPMASQAVGAGNPAKARRHLREALILCWIIVVPISGLIFATLLPLPLLGIDKPTQEAATLYLLGRVPGLICLYIYMATRSYLQALEVTRPIFITTLVANLLNIPLTLFLTLGDRALLAIDLPALGFSGWGVFGAALATSIVTCAQMMMLWYAMKRSSTVQDVEKPQWSGMKQIFALGYPVSLQMLAEGGLFAIGTVLMGTFGPVILGGHQIALQVASFTFSLCLGVGSATSVRVGHAIGRHDTPAARRAGFAGMIAGVSIMAGSALCLVVWAKPIAMLFAKPQNVVEVAVPFLYIAAMFQLFDGMQVITAGALRGAGETQLAMRLNVLCHWGLAMPLALVLAFLSPVGSFGIWIGFTVGLSTVSFALVWGFHRITQQELHPVSVSHSSQN